MKRIVDLRSDSSSLPTEKMRKTMQKAKVGNDAFMEDPSVNELEKLAADKLGKEAALFVCSGTMANLISVMVYAGSGDSIIVGENMHIMLFELGGISRVGGIMPVTVRDDLGILDSDEIEKRFKRTSSLNIKVITLENTHNAAGGTVLTPQHMSDYSSIAEKYGVPIYVDGARIFDSAIAQDIEAKELVSQADSVMFCLSKGRCAPVGSVIAGRTEFIEEARKVRALVGGQMRQAGIIASAGIVALNEMIGKLKENRVKARFLANQLANIDGILIDLSRVQTNIVMFDVSPLRISANKFAEHLENYGVLTSVFTERLVRFITYNNISEDDMDYVLDATQKVTKDIRS